MPDRSEAQAPSDCAEKAFAVTKGSYLDPLPADVDISEMPRGSVYQLDKFGVTRSRTSGPLPLCATAGTLTLLTPDFGYIGRVIPWHSSPFVMGDSLLKEYNSFDGALSLIADKKADGFDYRTLLTEPLSVDPMYLYQGPSYKALMKQHFQKYNYIFVRGAWYYWVAPGGYTPEFILRKFTKSVAQVGRRSR